MDFGTRIICRFLRFIWVAKKLLNYLKLSKNGVEKHDERIHINDYKKWYVKKHEY